MPVDLFFFKNKPSSSHNPPSNDTSSQQYFYGHRHWLSSQKPLVKTQHFANPLQPSIQPCFNPSNACESLRAPQETSNDLRHLTPCILESSTNELISFSALDQAVVNQKPQRVRILLQEARNHITQAQLNKALDLSLQDLPLCRVYKDSLPSALKPQLYFRAIEGKNKCIEQLLTAGAKPTFDHCYKAIQHLQPIIFKQLFEKTQLSESQQCLLFAACLELNDSHQQTLLSSSEEIQDSKEKTLDPLLPQSLQMARYITTQLNNFDLHIPEYHKQHSSCSHQNLLNLHGQSLLTAALIIKNPDLVKTLMNKGAHLDFPNTKGVLPKDFAKDNPILTKALGIKTP